MGRYHPSPKTNETARPQSSTGSAQVSSRVDVELAHGEAIALPTDGVIGNGAARRAVQVEVTARSVYVELQHHVRLHRHARTDDRRPGRRQRGPCGRCQAQMHLEVAQPVRAAVIAVLKTNIFEVHHAAQIDAPPAARRPLATL